MEGSTTRSTKVLIMISFRSDIADFSFLNICMCFSKFLYEHTYLTIRKTKNLFNSLPCTVESSANDKMLTYGLNISSRI